ncbi:MAG: hypothetical protein IKS54_04885 [Erysipelotrichaceae bacterium]|nr:hypothetical protein [Erysipelotrichaceae bacterium]
METLDRREFLIPDQSTRQLEEQASDFLKSGYFFAALQFYKKLLETQPENKDYRLACLMAQNNVKDEGNLIGFYQNLYSDAKYEKKKACEEDTSYIEEMLEKSYVEDYLEKDEIRRVFDFDLEYDSVYSCRIKQKEEIIKFIEEDDHLSWLKNKGFSEINEIIRAYDKRIDNAELEDKQHSDAIRNEYQRFLYRAYSRAKDLNRKAKNQKEEDYKKLIDRYEKSQDISELRDLVVSFGSFKDYKQAKRYIFSCEEKIEELKKQNEDVSLKKNIDESIDQARTSLLKKRFGEAYDRFAKVVSLDPENEEAHIGILMAQTKTIDLDELFDYYKALYSEDKKEKYEAVEEDSKHIEEMAEKYYLPDYLDKETIREKYLFDRSYLSSLDNRLNEESQIREELEMNPVFVWLSEHGSKDFKKRIDDLYDTYQRRVIEAKEEDEKNIERIRNEYQRFLFKTYADIKKLYNNANDRKDEEYRSIISSYNSISNEKELNDLIERLKALDNYKDSERYIGLCQIRINEIEKRRKKEYNDQEIETTLIAGRSYLLAGNKDLANRSFDKVLSLDEGNPYAYLGILMIETGTRDYESLIRYYQDLYTEDVSEALEGCPIDRFHIDEIADQYYIPGYFEKDSIRRYYNFDRSYESYTKSRIDQKKQLEEEMDLNPLFVKISERKDDEINDIFDRILNAYDERIRQSKENDSKQCKSIQHIYEIYLKETDRTIEKIYDEKLKERNDDLEARYKENVNSYFESEDPDELESLVEKFENDRDYKDSESYIDRCKEKAKQLRIERERDTLDALFNEGDELLEKGLYNQAKEKYVSYLKINPDDEDAHLYLLMAETHTEDIDSLFDYYKRLYGEEIPETFEVEDDRRDHIEEICEKCYIPGDLEKDEIRKQYHFDRSYESFLNNRIIQKKEIENEVEFNPSLLWLKENGSAKVRGCIDDLLDHYSDRIRESEKQDQANVELIRKEYRSFVREKDREIRSLYNALLKERNEERRRAEKERKALEQKQREEEERLRKEKEEKERAELEQKELEKQQYLESEKEKRRIEREKADLERRTLRELEKERKRQEKAESEEKELEKQRLSQLEREEKRKAKEKADLERQAQRRLEKERKKQERARLLEERRKKKEAAVPAEGSFKEKTVFKPNIGIVMAVISLLILGAVSYTYLLVPMNKYNDALAMVEEGNYDDAIALFTELGDYRDSVYKVKETSYQKADDLYRSGDLIAAANSFKDLRFDDSEDRVKAIKDQMMSDCKIGDTIIFGQYEQDGNLDNGREFIEWEVLDIQEGSILVISKYGIEAQKFNSTSSETYWINSTIRTWLNGRFADNAFDSENPSMVLQSTLTNYQYPFIEDENETDADEIEMEVYETRDNLFLLSQEEVEQYYPDEILRKCLATEYAIENGVGANADNSCSWWLRSPNTSKDNTSQIIRGSDGVITSSMYEITNAVRPAMWLKHD